MAQARYMGLKRDLAYCAWKAEFAYHGFLNMRFDFVEKIVLELDWKYRRLWIFLQNLGLSDFWPELDVW